MLHTGEGSSQFMFGPAAAAAAGPIAASGSTGAIASGMMSSGAWAPMAASGGGGGGGMGGAMGMGIGGAFGSALGNFMGMGKRKSTGFGKAFENSLYYQRKGAENSFGIFQQYAPQMADIARDIGSADAMQAANIMQQSAEVSPVFRAAQDRVLSDLDNEGRNSKLEEAFAKRVRSSQAARGQFGSNFSALSESFQGLQFGEQLRQQSLANAFGFLNYGSTRVAPQFGGIGTFGMLENPGFGVGLQQFAFRNQQRERDINNMISGLESAGAGIGGAMGAGG